MGVESRSKVQSLDYAQYTHHTDAPVRMHLICGRHRAVGSEARLASTVRLRPACLALPPLALPCPHPPLQSHPFPSFPRGQSLSHLVSSPYPNLTRSGDGSGGILIILICCVYWIILLMLD